MVDVDDRDHHHYFDHADDEDNHNYEQYEHEMAMIVHNDYTDGSDDGICS